jgi:hypothetical protein
LAFDKRYRFIVIILPVIVIDKRLIASDIIQILIDAGFILIDMREIAPDKCSIANDCLGLIVDRREIFIDDYPIAAYNAISPVLFPPPVTYW